MDLAESIGLAPVDNRDAATGNPPLADEESILNSFDNVQLILSTDADQGQGKLFITESRVIWLSSQDSNKGYSVDFYAISMHAIANDDHQEGADKPYLYVQISTDDDYNDDQEEEILPELRLFSNNNPTQLEDMFQAFCEGAVRNPDIDVEEEGQGNLFFNQGEALAGALEGVEVESEEGDIEELVGSDPDRFGDPEEKDDDDREEGPPSQNGTGI